MKTEGQTELEHRRLEHSDDFAAYHLESRWLGHSLMVSLRVSDCRHLHPHSIGQLISIRIDKSAALVIFL